MQKIFVVAAAIRDEHGRILCAQRGLKETLPYKWEFPGGKVEPNETPREALKRELKEELDVEADILDYIYSVDHDYALFSLNLSLYTAEIKGEIQRKEHRQIRWIPLEDAYSLDWAPADYPLLKKLLQNF